MAKVKQPSIIEEFGAIGDRVYYTRFGKTFSCRRPTQINDQKSEAKLRQRALFKATNTAYIPTISPDEKRTEKKTPQHRPPRVTACVYWGGNRSLIQSTKKVIPTHNQCYLPAIMTGFLFFLFY